LAHFTCLAAARAAVLKSHGWDANENGLFGVPEIRVLTSEHRHGSIDRAVRYLGMGNRSLETIPTNDHGQITGTALKTALKKNHGPTILVLDAADLNIAAFDPFSNLIPIARETGTWVHVDGAFGLFARASRAKKYLTEGIEKADSWAADAHKWLNVPFDCGIAIVKDRAAHREAMPTVLAPLKGTAPVYQSGSAAAGRLIRTVKMGIKRLLPNEFFGKSKTTML